MEGSTAEQGPRGFARVEHDDERDGQSDPEYFGHAETPLSILVDGIEYSSPSHVKILVSVGG